jgi:enolase
MKIKAVKAKEIKDSKGFFTVEVELKTDCGKFKASVPSGISTGKYEAVELRDPDGKGVKGAIKNIEKIICPVLLDKNFESQKDFDKFLIETDGTANKSRLGANALLPISIAACRAISKEKNIPLYQYISQIIGGKAVLPKPSFNMIEGGKHATSGPAFQEFMAVCQKEKFDENLQIGLMIYAKLGKIIEKKFGKVPLSQEGAFAAPVKTAYEALDLIMEAVKGQDIKIAIDAAGARAEDYADLVDKYPIMSIEDPFGEEDFENFAAVKEKLQDRVLIIGDDLTTTNISRISLAQEKGACSGVILKPNQIGTVLETIAAAKLAKSYGWKLMVSNRGGETKDDFISDLAVGVGADFIKSGAPHPAERMAKYERLVRIEEELCQN